MDPVNKTVYQIRDLDTRSVTLFPTKAQVVREIKDITLKNGSNEIVVVGLSPTVDPDSIKIEGSGSAIISNIAVERLPNRDIFEDIYPDLDQSDRRDDEDLDDAVSFRAVEDEPEWQRLQAEAQEVLDSERRTIEEMDSAEAQLLILKNHISKSVQHLGIVSTLNKYREQREAISQVHDAALIRLRTLKRQHDELKIKITRVTDSHSERLAVRVRAAEQRARRRLENLRETARVRTELESFWPRLCYTVTITLDLTIFSPDVSRHVSVASLVESKPPSNPTSPPAYTTTTTQPADSSTSTTGVRSCDLLLSYVTSSAFWCPSYDLQLSTVTSSGTLCFDAQLTNHTSETWANARITLSTSQTFFTGLDDAIPTLVPWRIKLASRHHGILAHDILHSREERTIRDTDAKRRNAVPPLPRDDLFGRHAAGSRSDIPAAFGKSGATVPPLDSAQYSTWARAQINNHMQPQMLVQMQQQSAPVPPPQGVFASAPFGKGGAERRLMSKSAKSFRKEKWESGDEGESEVGRRGGGGGGGGGGGNDVCGDGASTLLSPDLSQPQMDFQDSEMDETGLTTTYDLPHRKTIAPRSAATKQRVGRVAFANVAFAHTVVAKYRPAAFLRAKVRNTSKLTLLRGPAGLTLDGAFLGRTNLPRCSLGDVFTLSLGIDPAIKVLYPAPDVRRATSGLFSKEDSAAYVRTLTLVNTRPATATAARPIDLTVLDQAPVSEDERLRVDLVGPRGLVPGGAAVAAGTARDTTLDKDWGRATASARKDGEVVWAVTLNPGRAVKLTLEYVVTAPAGDHAVQC